jgi:hypothetical protein
MRGRILYCRSRNVCGFQRGKLSPFKKLQLDSKSCTANSDISQNSNPLHPVFKAAALSEIGDCFGLTFHTPTWESLNYSR